MWSLGMSAGASAVCVVASFMWPFRVVRSQCQIVRFQRRSS
jgi:hypothetical protein